VSNSLRMAVIVILAIVGILALVVGVIYLAVAIHSLPGFIPGKHPVNGHYHKRGAIALVIGIVVLAIAGAIGFRTRRQVTAPTNVASPTPTGEANAPITGA
jgi:hypothetical protein